MYMYRHAACCGTTLHHRIRYHPAFCAVAHVAWANAAAAFIPAALRSCYVYVKAYDGVHTADEAVASEGQQMVTPPFAATDGLDTSNATSRNDIVGVYIWWLLKIGTAQLAQEVTIRHVTGTKPPTGCQQASACS
jgi:hypothetical protein